MKDDFPVAPEEFDGLYDLHSREELLKGIQDLNLRCNDQQRRISDLERMLADAQKPW